MPPCGALGEAAAISRQARRRISVRAALDDAALSAMAMKPPGDTRPRSGCGQRNQGLHAGRSAAFKRRAAGGCTSAHRQRWRAVPARCACASACRHVFGVEVVLIAPSLAAYMVMSAARINCWLPEPLSPERRRCRDRRSLDTMPGKLDRLLMQCSRIFCASCAAWFGWQRRPGSRTRRRRGARPCRWRAPRTSRALTTRSSSSPASCPRVSLITLKPSRSRNSRSQRWLLRKPNPTHSSAGRRTTGVRQAGQRVDAPGDEASAALRRSPSRRRTPARSASMPLGAAHGADVLLQAGTRPRLAVAVHLVQKQSSPPCREDVEAGQLVRSRMS